MAHCAKIWANNCTEGLDKHNGLLYSHTMQIEETTQDTLYDQGYILGLQHRIKGIARSRLWVSDPIFDAGYNAGLSLPKREAAKVLRIYTGAE